MRPDKHPIYLRRGEQVIECINCWLALDIEDEYVVNVTVGDILIYLRCNALA